MEVYEQPIKVIGERVWRTWMGGRELDRIHGVPDPKDGYFPEEWMLSTTTARNVGREHIEEGLGLIADAPERTSLRDVVAAHPAEMLGAVHAKRFGTSQGVLAKLLDSSVRLPIQSHPDKATAMRLFDSPFGKTEAWHILGLRDENACLHMGFREGATREKWKDCFDRQDAAGMLDLMHRIVPEVGDTYIIYAGVPHAIGAGCFIVEIQEPTDLTIRTEKNMPYGYTLDDAAMHNGIGFERMFDCFHYDGVSLDRALAEWRVPARILEKAPEYVVEEIIGYDATDCFRMERLTVTGSLPVPRGDRFSGLYVRSGAGVLRCGGREQAMRANDQFFLPAASGDFVVGSGGGEPLQLLRFYGPRLD